MKNDLIREVTLSDDSDHSYKVLSRKWLPTPFYPRDFYTTFNWKRLDQKRVAIFCYDNSNEDYEEMLRAIGRRNPPVNSSKVVKGGNTTIMLLEEVSDRRLRQFCVLHCSNLSFGSRRSRKGRKSSPRSVWSQSLT